MTTEIIAQIISGVVICGLLLFCLFVVYLRFENDIRQDVKRTKLFFRNLWWDIKQIGSVVVYLWGKRHR